MNQIEKTGKLWLGDSSDAGNRQALDAAGITAVLNCAIDLASPLDYPRRAIAICPLIDGPGNSLRTYYAGVLQLRAFMKNNKCVLAHCHAGKSRSVSIVAAYLQATDPRGSYHEWLAEIALRREIDPNAAHLRKLDRFDWDLLRKLIG